MDTLFYFFITQKVHQKWTRCFILKVHKNGYTVLFYSHPPAAGFSPPCFALFEGAVQLCPFRGGGGASLFALNIIASRLAFCATCTHCVNRSRLHRNKGRRTFALTHTPGDFNKLAS